MKNNFQVVRNQMNSQRGMKYGKRLSNFAVSVFCLCSSYYYNFLNFCNALRSSNLKYLLLTGINVVLKQQLIKKKKKTKGEKKLALRRTTLRILGRRINISGMSQSCQYPWAKHANKFNRVRVFHFFFFCR